MNPEVHKHNFEVEEPLNLPVNGPIDHTYRDNKDRIIKRASWLLNFTDKHPLFYGQNSFLPDDDSYANDIFNARIGKKHLKAWKQLGADAVKKSADNMANYGYELVGEIIDKLDYHSQNGADYYPDIDGIDPFNEWPIKNSLQKIAKEHSIFKRILSLIYLSAKQSDSMAENERLAVFSTLVGFAQSYTDNIAESDELKKKQKHTMRDNILIYALHQYDHGLKPYFEALNNVVA